MISGDRRLRGVKEAGISLLPLPLLLPLGSTPGLKPEDKNSWADAREKTMKRNKCLGKPFLSPLEEEGTLPVEIKPVAPVGPPLINADYFKQDDSHVTL